MGVADWTLWAQTGAVVSAATAGLIACCGARRQRRDGLVGTALLVGALLTGMDSIGGGTHGLPLASWALLAFGLLTAITGRSAARIGRNPLRLVLLGAIAVAALHQVHVSIGSLPTFAIGEGAWQPVDLCAAAVLGWLAGRRSNSHAGRMLLATHAFSLAGAAFLPGQHAALLASLPILGAVPFLLRALPQDWPAIAVTGATAATFGLTCCIRAASGHAGLHPQFAGMQDPLLLCALLNVALGTALLRAYLQRQPNRHQLIDQRPTANPAPAAADREGSPSTVAGTDLGATDAAPTQPLLTTLEVLHDLRQPITSMLAAAGLLNTRQDSELASQVATLRTYGQQLVTAFGDLEQFEQLRHGSIEFAKDTFELRQVLHASVSEAASAVADRSIELRLDIDPTTPRWLQGDPKRLHQLMVRMLRALGERSTMGPIDISVSATDTLTISMLARSATLPAGNRKLGIAFCRQLARAMRGDLLITTLSDLGIELRLCLPKCEAPQWEVDLLAEDEAHSQGPSLGTTASVSGKILLVDDSPDHLLLVGRMLSRTGAQVSTANSGELALHLLSGTPFDLVLLDMQMPGIDGHTTVQRLREQGVNTPVLALTADTNPADVEGCLAAGCNGHIGKPVDFGLLRQALAMHMAIVPK